MNSGLQMQSQIHSFHWLFHAISVAFLDEICALLKCLFMRVTLNPHPQGINLMKLNI